MRNIVAIISLFIAAVSTAQNLVPNPSFELQDNCGQINPDINCSTGWSQFLDADPTNTPDIGFEGAVFFPPSTIDAQDGDNYLNLECSTGNPEYAQISMNSEMTAGTTYCVSFFGSVSLESPSAASLGIYFTDAPLNNSPFEMGIEAHVQGQVEFDPTQWTQISGTYTAQGGENILVIGGFENTGQMPFPYMYADMISVTPMPNLLLPALEWCGEDIELSVFAAGATYLWSDGSTSSTFTIDQAGTVSIERTLGVCTQSASVDVTVCNDIEIPPVDTIPVDTANTPSIDSTESANEIGPYYIPNAFTPDGDGINDVFFVYGPEADRYSFRIFNRWGELIFESNEVSKPWTGNVHSGGYYAPDGSYAYQLEVVNGQKIFEQRGHLILIR